MRKNPVLALIIVASNHLQDGLLALMTSSCLINAVLVAEEASLALRMVKDRHPNPVLLDSQFPHVQIVLQQIKNQWPQTGCIILVSSVEQERAFNEADAVLIEGFSPTRLMATTKELLREKHR